MWTFVLLTLTLCMQCNISFTSALTCFDCQGIRHPRFCEYVKDCVDGQVCGLERQIESNGAAIFNIGCMSSNKCNTNPNTVNGAQTCSRCCSTDLCNNFGCGESDHNSNVTVCYSCQGELISTKCQSVTYCGNNEICYVEERSRLGERFYYSGCKETNICGSQIVSGPIIGRRQIIKQRSTPLICCSTGLCNNASHFISAPSALCTAGQKCFNGGTCHIDSSKCTCANGYIGDNCQYTDGKDTRFVVIFHEIYHDQPIFIPYITPKLLVASERPVNLSVYYFRDHRNQSVITNKTNPEYNMDRSVLMKNGIHNAGVTVHSNVSVTMYGFLFEQYTKVSEGFLIIPERFASKEFVIPSYTQIREDESSVFAISPLFDGTVIEIMVKIPSGTVTYNDTNFSNGDKIQLKLDQYMTFQLAHKADLSGTMVTSSLPVVVVSGNTLNRILPNTDHQPFMEMVLPTNQLDHLYIIPVITKRPQSVVRIQSVNATSLLIKSDNVEMSNSTKSRDCVDYIHTTISYIQSSSDVLVMMYPEELPDFKGDAFMMTIPGVNQYLQSYDFVAPTGFDSFISITVTSGGVDGFILDGQQLTNLTIINISEGSDQYSTFSMPVTNGTHHIEHSRNLRFGLWVYGYFDPLDAYGYPGGIAFKIFK